MPDAVSEYLKAIGKKPDFSDVTSSASTRTPKKRTPLTGDAVTDYMIASGREFPKEPKKESRGIRAGLETAVGAVRNPGQAIKGMAAAVKQDYRAATNKKIIGGFESDVIGYDQAGDPIRKPMSKASIVSKDTPGAQTMKDYGKGARNTVMNAAFAVAPTQGIIARSLLNAGAGAVQDDDDRLRGATAGLLLGETLHQGIKAPGRVKRGILGKLDVSEGVVAEGASGVKEAGQEAVLWGPNRRPRETLPANQQPPVEPKPDATTFSTKGTARRRIAAKVAAEEPKPAAVEPEPSEPAASGETYKVYHGTDAPEFDEFKPGTAQGWGTGVYLTDSPAAAAEFGSRVVEGEVTLRRPYKDDGIPEGVEDTKAWKEIADKWEDVSDAWHESGTFVSKALRELGYDGVVAKNSNSIDGYEIVAFDPKAVKINRPKAEPETVSFPPEPDINPVVSANGEFQARPGVIRAVNRELAGKGPTTTTPLRRIRPEDIEELPPSVTVEEANRRIEAAVEAQKAAQERQKIVRGRWAPEGSLRNENGDLIKDLTNVPDEAIEAELRSIAEQNAAEEAQAAAVMESGYRHDYEELPRTEKLGRKGQEDLPDADGMVDSDRLAQDNKTMADFNKRQVVRQARARAAARLEAELAKRQPEKYRRIEDEPVIDEAPEPDTSFDFGANVFDPVKQPREYLNYAKFGLDQTTEARVRAAVEAGRKSGTMDKGRKSFDIQNEEAREFAKQLVANPLDLDNTKLKGLTGAQIVGLHQVVGENTRVAEAASRAMNSGELNAAEFADAQRVFDTAMKSTNEALTTIVREKAETARGLGFFRQIAKQSTDPDVWLVHAKKMLGDKPLPDTLMLEIRKLANEAAEACR